MYNLCDLIKYKKRRGLNFKGSIAHEYLIKQGEPFYGHERELQEIDFAFLQSITRKRVKMQFGDDAFVIHARLFDGFNNNTPEWDVFIKIIKKYELNIKFKKCIVFYGNHKNNIDDSLIKKSEWYLKKLKDEIEKLNLTCELSGSSEYPGPLGFERTDEDFAALSNAKCYIAGYRGFGWLSASINPNEVIWDIQNPPNFTWLHGRWREVDYLMKGYNFQKQK